MIFIQIAKPNWFERALILIAQGIFWHFYLFLYIFFPRIAHRMVGYFEDQAVISYTQYLNRIERGDIENIDAPQIAIDYYNLKSNAKLVDVVKAVRADEQGHADVNHEMADELKGDKDV
jgi:ubiquinol oxidase